MRHATSNKTRAAFRDATVDKVSHTRNNGVVWASWINDATLASWSGGDQGYRPTKPRATHNRMRGAWTATT